MKEAECFHMTAPFLLLRQYPLWDRHNHGSRDAPFGKLPGGGRGFGEVGRV